MAGVEAAAAGAAQAEGAESGWGGSNGGFTLDPKPRTYYVVSFGGSGSKMLGGWLSERGKGMVKKVGGQWFLRRLFFVCVCVEFDMHMMCAVFCLCFCLLIFQPFCGFTGVYVRIQRRSI